MLLRNVCTAAWSGTAIRKRVTSQIKRLWTVGRRISRSL